MISPLREPQPHHRARRTRQPIEQLLTDLTNPGLRGKVSWIGTLGGRDICPMSKAAASLRELPAFFAHSRVVTGMDIDTQGCRFTTNTSGIGWFADRQVSGHYAGKAALP